MKERHIKINTIIVASVITIGGTVLAFILNLLFKIHNAPQVLQAEWSAGEALNYVAVILGAVGTFTLGYIAYKQNDRLQEMERNNYIANHSSMMLVKEIAINQVANVPVNWEIHSEQIVVEKNAKIEDYNAGYKMTFTAEKIGESIPSLVHIRQCNINCSDRSGKNLEAYLFGENYSTVFSRVAIHKDGVFMFEITFVMDKEKRKSFEEAIKQDAYEVIVEMIFDIVTDKNVATKCKCRSYCVAKSDNQNITWSGNDPMVFFYGHSFIDDNSIVIAGEEKDNG